MAKKTTEFNTKITKEDFLISQKRFYIVNYIISKIIWFMNEYDEIDVVIKKTNKQN